MMSKVGLLVAPALFALLLLIPPLGGMSASAWQMLAITIWVVIWWMTEAVPIPIASLLPMVLQPCLGLKTMKEAAAPYSEPIVYLFLGGFLLALALQKHRVHKRMALHLIRYIGTKPEQLLLGFMLATVFISMWINNTAATMMMLPMAISVVELLFRDGSTDDERNFVKILMLCIAYGATIGGLGTLIGTAPNAFFAAFMEKNYQQTVGFANWMLAGVPLVAVSAPLSLLILTRFVFPIRMKTIAGADALIAREIAELGAWSRGEVLACLVFGTAVFGWVVQSLAESVFKYKPMWLTDASVAMLAGLSLFVLPTNWKKGEMVLDWETARYLPWDLLLLFGGGLSLAAGIQDSGLSAWIGGSLTGLGGLNPWLMVFLLVCLTIFLTEFTSNTALTATLLPLVGPLAVQLHVPPMLLLVPATLAASTGFMMPVGTPPNAIAYGTGYLRVRDMMRGGWWLNVLFACLVTVFSMTLFRWALGY